MTTGFSTSGATLLLNGNSFLPVGWNSIASLLATPHTANHPEYTAAFEQFTGRKRGTLAAMRHWNANIIRFQVVQNSVNDPTIFRQGGKSSGRGHLQTYGALYIDRLKQLVNLTHKAGLGVMLCVNNNLTPPAGDWHGKTTNSVIGPITTAAWQTLAYTFADNPFVMYELYNETTLDTSQWTTWNTQHQGLVDAIRQIAPNVIIAGGAAKGKSFAGASGHLLTERTGGHGIVYAVHPYDFADPDKGTTQAANNAAYDTEWGWIVNSNIAPVLATEWYSTNAAKNDTTVAYFLAYCKAHNIGITPWVFDDLCDPKIDPNNPTASQTLMQIITLPSGVPMVTCGSSVGATAPYWKPWAWEPSPPGVPWHQWANANANPKFGAVHA